MSLFQDVVIPDDLMMLHAELYMAQGKIRVKAYGLPQPVDQEFQPAYNGLAVIAGKMAVWVDESNIVRWDAAARELVCRERPDGNREIEVHLLVNRDIEVVPLSKDPDSKHSIWLKRITCFATPCPDELFFPSIPVVERALPFVDLSQGLPPAPEVGPGTVTWKIPLHGGVRATLTMNKDGITKIGKPEETKEVAVWPPVAFGSPWRFYSVLLNLRGNPKPKVRFWSRDEGTDYLRLVREDAPEEKVYYSDYVHTLTLKGSTTALFVEILEKSEKNESLQGSGLYPLVVEPVRCGDAQPTIVVDFGTSNTAGAISLSQDNPSIDFGHDRFSSPRVLVGTPKQDKKKDFLEPDLPWLPTVPSRLFGGGRPIDPAKRNVPFHEIPSALYTYGEGEQWKEGAPFANFGLVGPGADIGAARGTPKLGWATGLKWADADGRTEYFLSCLLLWIAGLYASQMRSIFLAATYPLAFDQHRRTAFEQALLNACTNLERWTGFSAGPIQRGNGSPLIVDEGTALQFCAEEALRFHPSRARTKLVLTADIGGGTFDLSLSALREPGFRVLAADSVKFGAELVINAVDERVQFRDISGAADPRRCRHLVCRTVREGRLPMVMSASLDAQVAAPWKQGLGEEDKDRREVPNWASTSREAALRVQERCHLFYYLLVEYLARFVAGTLRDVEAIKYRLRRAPGGAEFHEDSEEFRVLTNAVEPVAIVPILGGNGWGFLCSEVAGLTFTDFARLVTDRTSELLGSEDRIEWQWNIPLPRGKVLCSRGALRAADPRGNDIHVNHCDVQASPNGIDDCDEQSVSNWWIQVGEGSLAREGKAPPPFSTSPLHGRNMDTPGLSRKIVVPSQRARNILQTELSRLHSVDAEGTTRKMQFDSKPGAGYRVCPTVRAYWTVVMSQLVSKNPIA